MTTPSGWQVTPGGTFERPGAVALVCHDRYPEGKQGGLELIQHGERVAANGNLWLAPVPGQWEALPQPGERRIDADAGTVRVPSTYAAEDVTYTLWARSDGDALCVGVDLDVPLPGALLERAGFILELFPGLYAGRPFFMDTTPGVFPQQAQGPVTLGPGGAPLPGVLASGSRLVIAPDDPLRRLEIEALGDARLLLLDGRDVAHNGWFVVRSQLPAGATSIAWRITPNVVEDWRRAPVICLSQVGYHPEQVKRVIFELDPRAATPEQAALLRLNPDGGAETVLEAQAEPWGTYLRYTYAVFDFTTVREPGLYAVRYAGQTSSPFRIERDVYRQGVWQPALETFLPVQMCHVAVRDRERIWHGACHLDDACQSPPSHTHFDGYVQGAASDGAYVPGEHVPGLDRGGWHDAGDDDLANSSQVLTTLILSLAYETFAVQSDQTTVRPDERLALLHTPDGVPDFVHQIAHGAEALLAGYRALGHCPMGIIARDLNHYTRLGDPASCVEPAARWVFTGRHTAREYQTAAALAAASRALRGHRDALSAACLEAAVTIWDYEQAHPPAQPDDAYVMGPPEMAEVMATVELLLATGDAHYRQRFPALWRAIQANIVQVGWCVARALPAIGSKVLARKLRGALQLTRAMWDTQVAKNPFGLPLQFQVAWGASWDLLLQGVGKYYLIRTFPDLFDREQLLRVVNYVLGCHPGSGLSLVSGVGGRSVTAAYGANRADAGYIPGGVVSGPSLIRPDFPELKTGFPHLWQQVEYVIYGAAAYLFCVLAAERLLNEDNCSD